MPDLKDVEKKICKMLDMGDEDLLAEMERSFQLSDERHQRISDTLEEMMQEVDRLISRIDEIEDESLEDEALESSTR
ncbi:MAG: hypothetical protein WA137_00460 [Methanothrix sp.]|jgi:uncharacterized membrane protein YccC|nr:hypothetical protein [Methanothrix sp.]